MSDSPYGAMPPAPGPWPPQPPRRPSRWPAFAALALAVVATAVAIGAWFRPARVETPPAPTYSAQEVQDAKTKVCEAYAKFSQAVTATSSKEAGMDPATALTVAVNVRLALHAGSQYLLSGLEKLPATQPELANAIRDLADTYNEIAILQLGDTPESEMQPLVGRGENATKEIYQVCKK